MRNQDLNLDKQQYEILACHKNLLLTDCLPSKNIMKWLFTTQKLYKITAYQAKTL